MNVADEIGPEHGGDDLTAAEYVVGVLPADERQVVSDRIEADRAFAGLVDWWEVQFAPLAAAYPEVAAPDGVKPAIDVRLFSAAPETAAAVEAEDGGFWSSLALWRGIAFAALAALAFYIALPFLMPATVEPQGRLVASLAAEGSDVHYLVIYDPASGAVALSHVSGERAEGRDFELWMIEGDDPPVSMGVIPVGAATHVVLPEAARERIASGDVLAVSLEPAGGSPTGQPTGPVVAAGDLKTI